MGLYMENRRICSGLSGFCLLLASNVASAHELWLDSEKFQYEIGDKVEVSLINGTQFDGVNLPYFTRRVSELYYSIDTRVDSTSRLGDLPAFQQVIDTAGLARFVYVSKIDNITYRGLKKFTAFVQEKDATWALQRHLDNNWPTDRFTERYFRHSKALIDIGHPYLFNYGLDFRNLRQKESQSSCSNGYFRFFFFYGNSVARQCSSCPSQLAHRRFHF